MYHNYLVPALAQSITTQMAQTAYLNTKNKDALIFLARNKSLTKASWFALEKTASALIAYELAGHNLDEQQLRQLLKDKRVTVRRELFAKGLSGLTPALAQEIVTSAYFDRDLAAHWLESKKVPTNLINQVARKQAGLHLLQEISNPEIFTIDEAQEILQTISKVVLGRGKVALYRLFDKRPELIAFAVDLNRSELLPALSGSRHLFDMNLAWKIYHQTEKMQYSYAAGIASFHLAINPNLNHQLRDKAFDLAKTYAKSAPHPANIQLAARTLQSDMLSGKRQPPITDPWENLTGQNLQEVKKVAKILGINRYPTINEILKDQTAPTHSIHAPTGKTKGNALRDLSEVNLTHNSQRNFEIVKAAASQIEEQLNPLGEAAWQTLISLSYQWSEDLASLLETVKSLHS